MGQNWHIQRHHMDESLLTFRQHLEMATSFPANYTRQFKFIHWGEVILPSGTETISKTLNDWLLATAKKYPHKVTLLTHYSSTIANFNYKLEGEDSTLPVQATPGILLMQIFNTY